MSRKRIAGTWLAICVATAGAAEGLRTVAYLDPVGIPTVCFGETRGVRMGDKYTVEQCKDMFSARLIEFDQNVRRCVHVPMTEERRAAVVSFAYNVGVGAFCGSTFARKLNANDNSACDELRKWVYATKAGVRIKLPGLVKRREEERRLCMGEAA
jgi:lysozyme